MSIQLPRSSPSYAKRAMRLFAAAEASLESIGAQLPALLTGVVDQSTESARQRLGDQAGLEAGADGRLMSLEEAIDFATAVGE